ncbi:uncharacterized protein LOC121355086 isoform X1 [Pyrgilauda ruficollis]|uniref:uncharacterized protein LOC121355086 isoform X1 n=1 Tax=Pyrgilauda ruficollis TaxID=221976 RepID=UPI001B86E904|nr:uncharacterized protein LOC121355086 isoform X1 [Pyrgilauda ruficollis]
MSARAPRNLPCPSRPGSESWAPLPSRWSRDLQLRGWQRGQSPAAQGMAEGTGPCSSGDGRGDSAEHRDHPVPTLEPRPAVHRNGNAGDVGMLQVLAPCPWGERGHGHCSRWAGGSSGCGQGVPVLLGSLSWRGQSLPPGWLSRGGTFPAGGAKCCSLLGAPLSPPGRWGPDQPRDEGPLWLKPHGAGTGLGQRPCKCHLVSAGSPLHRSHPTFTPSGLSSLQPPHPGCPLCALPVPSPGGQLLSLSLSLCQPRCPLAAAAPRCWGWLSVLNRLLQPPRPRTGVNWGFCVGDPRGHRGVTAAPLPPGTPQHPQD